MSKLWWYIVILVLSFIIVFFVKFDVVKTQDSYWDIQIERKMTFSLDGYKSFRKWLDVAWWVRLTYKIDFSKYEALYNNQELFEIKKQIKQIIKKNIENRISKLWVSDYSINILNLNWQDYLQVEIWWINDLDYAKKVIWKTVELEFKVPFEGEDDKNIFKYRQVLAEDILKKVINSGVDLSKFENIDEWIYYFNLSNVSERDLPKWLRDNIDKIISMKNNSVYPSLISWSMKLVYPYIFKGEKIYDWWFIVKNKWYNLSGDSRNYNLEVLFITKKPFWILAKDPNTNEILNGAYFKYATVWQDQKGYASVDIQFDDKWKSIFCNLTKKYLWKSMAIFVGNKLVTAPTIQAEICWWTAQITGNFSPEEAKKLAKDLNEGALPAKLILSQEEKISPVLWEKALVWAVIAWFVWLFLIFLLLIWMYNIRWALIWLFSLIEFLLVVLAVVKITDYAMSLAGISAILLSIGIAVDANILMYERIKEELKSWNSFFIAVQNWLERSWNAIRDWNLTTGMIALILFMIWMNVFKGFWTMMILNIIVTLFILVPFTRALLEVFWEDK